MTSAADRFGYPLPFGAEPLADGQTRFRLWAPDRDAVAVRLEPSGTELAMQREAGGWFALTTEAAPGTAYRYRVAGDLLVPDPASRAQADDVHGPSLVIDPRAYRWRTHDWAGRPWEEAVVCELHVGTATPEGTFEGLRRRLDHYVDTGITAIEIMPVADFSGTRGWGYDGVLLYAPERSYGTPEDLKRLIDEAHGRGIMVPEDDPDWSLYDARHSVIYWRPSTVANATGGTFISGAHAGRPDQARHAGQGAVDGAPSALHTARFPALPATRRAHRPTGRRPVRARGGPALRGCDRTWRGGQRHRTRDARLHGRRSQLSVAAEALMLFRPSREARTAQLRLTAAARWVPEYYPVEVVEEVGDGSLLVSDDANGVIYRVSYTGSARQPKLP